MRRLDPNDSNVHFDIRIPVRRRKALSTAAKQLGITDAEFARRAFDLAIEQWTTQEEQQAAS